MKKQWEKRVAVSNYLYQCLVLDYAANEMVANLIHDDFELDQLDLLEHIAGHLDELIQTLKIHLVQSWTWERINMVDKAIMLTAIGEVAVWKTPKRVAIDQALITADHYNVDDSYKYINVVLDKVIKPDA